MAEGAWRCLATSCRRKGRTGRRCRKATALLIVSGLAFVVHQDMREAGERSKRIADRDAGRRDCFWQRAGS